MKFSLKNESGDRKYFTQIPNMIVNHSTAYEQSLYLIMKRLAGEGGRCYASLNFLSENMRVDKKTVSKTISKLLIRKWITETEKTKVIGGSVRTFIIIDLWKLNMDNYESGRQVSTLKSGCKKDESGRQILGSGRQKDTNNNINNINNKKQEFNFKELAEAYKNGDRRYKPYYRGEPMKWRKDKKMWYVDTKYDPWSEFADKESTIEWRKKG